MRIGLGVEVVSRVEDVVAEELEERAVDVVGARLGDDVDDRAGVAAVLGFDVERIAASAIASTGRIVAGVPNTPASLIAGRFR